MKKLKLIQASDDFYIPHTHGRVLVKKNEMIAYKKIKVLKVK